MANKKSRSAPEWPMNTPGHVSLNSDEVAMIPEIMRARARAEEGRIDETQPNYRAWPYPHLKGPADSPYDRRLIDAVLGGSATPEMLDALVEIQGRKGVNMPLTHGRYKDAGVKRTKTQPPAIINHPNLAFPAGNASVGDAGSRIADDGMQRLLAAAIGAQARAGVAGGDASTAALLPPGLRDARLRNADRVLAVQPGAESHQADLERSRAFSRAIYEATAGGQRGVRGAVLDEIQQQYPDKNAWDVGTVTIGGGDPERILRGRSVPSGSLGAVSQRISGLGAPTGAEAQAPVPRGGAPTFSPGPSSQAGLDIASAMLQQRLGAMGQNQNMDLMYRRDPRAATALIAAQMQADNDRAAMQQRGDIARDELGYRREALGAQSQESAADRQAGMDRLLATLTGQRGMATERMNFDAEQADAARRAAIAEAAAQRAFQGGLADRQMKFQGNEGQLARQRSSESEARNAMLQTMLKGMEISGLDKRSQDDMRTKMIGAYANLAESANDPGYAAAKAELDKAFSGMNAQMSGTPQAPAPAQPKLAIDKVDPMLRAAWDKASAGKDVNTKKAVADFLMSMPAEDIENNREQLNSYIAARYGNKDLDSELSDMMNLFGNSRAKELNRVRSAMGFAPNQTTAARAFAIPFAPGMFDAIFGSPQ